MGTSDKTIAKNTLFLYGRLLFSMIIAIYTTRVVLDTLGVVDYGIYNVVCGFVSMLSFINITLSNGIQRFYNYEVGKNGEEAESKVYTTSFYIMILLCGVSLVLLETIGVWYINTKMTIPTNRLSAANWIYQFSIMSLLIVFLQIPYSAAIIAHEKMNYFAYVGVGDTTIKLLIAISLPFFSGDKLIIYGLLLFLVSISDFVLFYIYAKHHFPFMKLKPTIDTGLFRQIFVFSGWNTVETTAWISQNQGVNIVLNYFVGPVVNAANAIATQVNNALNGFCSSLSIAFRPQLFRSYAMGDYNKTTKFMYFMSKIMFVVYYMFFTVILLEIDYILKIWLGNSIPEYTKQFTLLVLCSMIPRNLTMCLSQIVHATGKMKSYQLISAIIIFTVLPTSIVILKAGFDPTYVFAFNIIMCIVLYVVDMVLLKRIYNYSIKEYILKVIIPIILCTFIIPLIPGFFRLYLEESLFRLITVGVTCVLSSCIAGYYIILSKVERKKILSIALKKIKRIGGYI